MLGKRQDGHQFTFKLSIDAAGRPTFDTAATKIKLQSAVDSNDGGSVKMVVGSDRKKKKDRRDERKDGRDRKEGKEGKEGKDEKAVDEVREEKVVQKDAEELERKLESQRGVFRELR